MDQMSHFQICAVFQHPEPCVHNHPLILRFQLIHGLQVILIPDEQEQKDPHKHKQREKDRHRTVHLRLHLQKFGYQFDIPRHLPSAGRQSL